MAEQEGEKKAIHEGHRQRMKERLLRDGLESFADHEAMEMLLYYALPYRDTNGLGHTLIDEFGGFANALDAHYADLVQVPGVTPHVATLVTLCGQMAHRYQQERCEAGKTLYRTVDIGNYAMSLFVGKKEESVVLISMDNRRRVLNTSRVFEGSVNSTQFNFRIAVQQALRDNATQVVMAHNHPSGFAFPSEADVKTTERFAQVLKLMNIHLVDHIVVAEDIYTSMASSERTAGIFRQEWEVPV